jgi:uncharacterized protein YneR
VSDHIQPGDLVRIRAGATIHLGNNVTVKSGNPCRRRVETVRDNRIFWIEEEATWWVDSTDVSIVRRRRA